MDEQELHALADGRLGPPVAWPSAGTVMTRGTRLRRRRRAVRSAGFGGVAVGMVGISFLAVGRKADREDVAADGATTTVDRSLSPPPSIPDCAWDWDLEDLENPPPRLDPAAVPDEMRVLPSYVPGGEPLQSAYGTDGVGDPCDTSALPADDALILRSFDAAGVVDAHIGLSGPLPWSTEQLIQASGGKITRGSVTVTDVPFRGGTAELVDGREIDSGVTFEWTDPDGWSWELRGDGIDSATLQAVGEALTLDSSPEGDEPVAVLPAGSVPAGMEVAWQQLGAPALITADEALWDVNIGRPPPEPNRIDCMVQVRPRQGATPIGSYGGVGTGYRTVNGHDAAWSTAAVDGLFGTGNTLTWEIAPGLLARAGCAQWTDGDLAPLAVDEVVRFAESLEPVAPDDPRIGG